MGGEKTLVVEVEAGAEGQRLDAYLAEHLSLGLSRAAVQRLIRDGRVTVGGRVAKPSRPVRAGEEITVSVPELRPPAVEPEPLPLKVLYEDGHFLVIDKPAGMVVHPAGGIRSGTVVNALLHHCAGGLSGIGGVERPGIVHRLDKETSGLLVAAKTDRAHVELGRQFASRTVEKRYLAIVHGVVGADEGVIEESVGRHPKERKRMAVVEGGRPALTEFRVLERFLAHTYLEVGLRTGRTHQVRVHLAFAGHPILGDRTYGGRRGRRPSPAAGPLIGRQALHAWRLALDHPVDGSRMAFEAPVPGDFQEALSRLGSAHGTGR